MSVRVRFAPSPTGHLHVGGARTALYNYLFAKNNNGKFILRIEDTDRERSTEASVKAILDGLKWLNLTWDEGPEVEGEYGPYFQSQRNDTYKPYYEKLIEEGNAYKCFCTRQELEEMREEAVKSKRLTTYDKRCRNLTQEEVQKKIDDGLPYVVRLKVPEGDIIFNDLIRGQVKFSSENIDDFVIVRSDNTPVYNFVVAIDDLLMKISHVIRGEDHISNTPKQILIYKLLGEKVPEFAHIPLILGKDKKRLSKRHGATSTDEYKSKGYPVEAFINYLALVGWAYDDKTTIFSREELIKYFSLEKVSKSGGVFDEEKLNWISGVYIREMNVDDIFENSKIYLEQAGFLNEKTDIKYIKSLIELVKDRIKLFNELPGQIDFFLKDLEYDKKALKNLRKANLELLTDYISFIKEHSFSSIESLHDDTNSFLEKKELKLKDIVHALRASITYKASGPSLFDIMFMLGKEKTISRLENGLKTAQAARE